MRKTVFLFLVSILSSCTLGTPPLDFSTPEPQDASPSATLVSATVPPTIALVTESAPLTPASESSDPFKANFLQLPAPACMAPTPQQTEGPYYTPGSPEKNILYEDGMPGEKLIVAGYVLDKNCQPIPGTWLDFWQADAQGVYDNKGFTLRGHQFTDRQGRYFLETVIPGEYPARTEHIHVKVRPPNGSEITSQLYFPNVSSNSSDAIFDPALIVTLEAREGLYVAYFNFILAQ